MDSSQSDITKGYEILTFEHAQIVKTESDSKKALPIDHGILKVLYFPEYKQFILNLNNFNYALLKDLTVACSSKFDFDSRTYSLPTNGGHYSLKLTNVHSLHAIQNFETIISYNSKFFSHGQHNALKEAEAEIEHLFEKLKKDFEEKMKTVKHPEEKLESTDKGVIKTATDKISNAFNGSSKNAHMSTHRSIDELMDVDRSFLTVHELSRKDVEGFINQNKSLMEHERSSVYRMGSMSTKDQQDVRNSESPNREKSQENFTSNETTTSG